MNGTVVQVNVSNGGVPKYPVPGAALAGKLGIEGDRQAHPQFHGGPRQALLLICSESIDELREQGWPVFYGALGENVTMRGLDRRQMRPGMRFRIGGAVVEITKPRQPCRQLDPYGEGIQKALYDKEVKAGNAASAVWGMGGFYASVEEAGWIQSGDEIVFLDQAV